MFKGLLLCNNHAIELEVTHKCLAALRSGLLRQGRRGERSLAIHCPFDDLGRNEALVVQTSDKGLRSPCAERSIHFQPLTTGAAAS